MKKVLLIPLSLGVAALVVLCIFIWPNPPAGGVAWAAAVSPPVASRPLSRSRRIWTQEQVPQNTLNYPPVGAVTLYGNATDPSAFVLFISGDGGWNLGVIDMAKTLAQDGQTLVAGIDIIKYYKKLQASTYKCLYPAGDMENLSEFVQKKLKLPEYLKPILVGYSSGATLTYALLCQAPGGTFRGGVALGFCPAIQINKPLCEGSGKLTMTRRKDGHGFDFTDQPAPIVPLEALHGEMDQDCDCQKTCDFFKNIKNVNVVRLPKVGHGYSVTRNWLPQFKQAFSRMLSETYHPAGMLLPSAAGHAPVALAASGIPNTASIPITVTPAPADTSTPMVLFISGDGGWTGFDQEICNHLAAKHLPSVGLNSQSYFWKKKTPEQTTGDLVPLLRQYLQTWDKSKIILVGYSFGANVAPFVVNRLPDDLREKVQAVVLLSPDPKGDFEIHVAGMLGHGGGPYDVVAEVHNLKNTRVLCVRGDQEEDDMEHALQPAAHVRFEKIPGSHHYDNDAARVAATILH